MRHSCFKIRLYVLTVVIHFIFSQTGYTQVLHTSDFDTSSAESTIPALAQPVLLEETKGVTETIWGFGGFEYTGMYSTLNEVTYGSGFPNNPTYNLDFKAYETVVVDPSTSYYDDTNSGSWGTPTNLIGTPSFTVLADTSAIRAANTSITLALNPGDYPQTYYGTVTEDQTFSGLYTSTSILATLPTMPSFNSSFTTDQSQAIFSYGLTPWDGYYPVNEVELTDASVVLTKMQYKFEINPEPSTTVNWDVVFTPGDGTAPIHNLMSWTGNNVNKTPTWVIDPSQTNGGINAGPQPVDLEGEVYGSFAVSLLSMKLEWQALDGNTNIDDNIDPFTNQKRGNRIFPDADAPGAGAKNHLKLKIEGGIPNAVVYLKAFDVDDPTPASFDNDQSIDPNDAAGKPGNMGWYTGNDNRGSVRTGLFSSSKAGAFTDSNDVTTQVTLDSNGEGTAEFIATMQPGDNFRVAAQMYRHDQRDLLQVDDEQKPYWVPPDDTSPKGVSFCVTSPLLTVWRKLRVETDSMEAVPDPKPSPDHQVCTGTATWTTRTFGTTVKTAIILNVPDAVPSDFYAGGKVKVTGGPTSYYINLAEANTAGSSGITVTLSKQLTQAQMDAFDLSALEIVDDDDMILPSSWSAVLPRTGLITDVVKSKFLTSFIQVEAAPATYSNIDVPFVLNTPTNFANEGVVPTEVKNKATLPNSNSYWGTTVTAIYQATITDDGDPNSEQPTYGETDRFLRISMICMESFIDKASALNSATSTYTIDENDLLIRLDNVVAHEMGHVPSAQGANADHAEGGIMDADKDGFSDAAFTPKSVSRFRGATSWQGY